MNGPMDAGQPIGDRTAVHRASIPFLGDRSAVRAELLSPESSSIPFLVACDFLSSISCPPASDYWFLLPGI
jgi:hypothetical protein